MNYLAVIHHLVTGRFLLECMVKGHDLRAAETQAIAEAALKSRGLPRDMDVRHLHQCKERRASSAGNPCV